jgi:hypothetical protein
MGQKKEEKKKLKINKKEKEKKEETRGYFRKTKQLSLTR